MEKLKKLIGVCALVGAGLFAGCDNDSGKKTSVSSNKPPVIKSISAQTVEEGKSFSIDLGSYVSDPENNPFTLSQISGPGNITNNVYTYQDQKDNDKNNNVHVVKFEARDSKGAKSSRSFSLVQNDTYYRINPSFLNEKMNWICYAPTNFNPNVQKYPSEDSIRKDLELLVDTNFKGIIIYGSNNVLGTKVPQIAKELGLKVIMGIWDLDNAEEWNNALAAKGCVSAYCLGNEGLHNLRYTLEKLNSKAEQLRRATDKPVTTAEIIEEYAKAELIDLGDWVFPNVHPYWHNIKDPAQAAQWTIQQYVNLKSKTDKIVLIKEAGMPSAGDTGLSEANQNKYFRNLEDLASAYPTTVFAYFEAFDQPWKNWAPVEPFWGIFKQDRTRKEASKPQVLFVYIPPINTYSDLMGRAVNVKPQDCRIATYIKVGTTWWIKPYWGTLTSISSNCTWQTDITTGGIDQTATQVFAAIVTPDYQPDGHILPVIGPKVWAINTATR